MIRDDHIQLTPNLPGWERLAISRRLAEEFGVPEVRVANDVRAGALAEVRSAPCGASTPACTSVWVLVLVVALTGGGRVLSGAHQAAGEIAYMNPGTAPIGAVAAGHAPLEELVGAAGLDP